MMALSRTLKPDARSLPYHLWKPFLQRAVERALIHRSMNLMGGIVQYVISILTVMGESFNGWVLPSVVLASMRFAIQQMLDIG